MSTVLVRRKERRKPPETPRGEILLESPPELPETIGNSFQNVDTMTPQLSPQATPSAAPAKQK